MSVYLAGPMANCTDNEASDWREVAKDELGADNCLDPMIRDYRGREAAHAREIVTADKQDILACNAVLANCWKELTGTAMEILFAWERGKPVVSVVPDVSRVSPWIAYHSVVIVSDLQEAISAVRSLGVRLKTG